MQRLWSVVELWQGLQPWVVAMKLIHRLWHRTRCLGRGHGSWCSPGRVGGRRGLSRSPGTPARAVLAARTQFSRLPLKMSTSYLARIFPDLENSIKRLSNT